MEVLTDDVKTQISNNIKLLLQTEQKTRRQVCTDLGIKYTTFCDWVNGKTTPSYKALEQLGEYFQVEPWKFYENLDESDAKRKRANTLLKYATNIINADAMRIEAEHIGMIKGRAEIINLFRWLRANGYDDEIEAILNGDESSIEPLIDKSKKKD